MSLHDRVMSLRNDVDGCGDEQDYFECAAYNAGIEQAAKLATEADELMAEMAEHLAEANFDNNTDMAEADRLVAKYNTYKERNNEQ